MGNFSIKKTLLFKIILMEHSGFTQKSVDIMLIKLPKESEQITCKMSANHFINQQTTFEVIGSTQSIPRSSFSLSEPMVSVLKTV